MLTVESEFAIAIYILYLIDCVHWLKPGEMALTRGWRNSWRTHLFQDDSYTLLGYMPVFVNPVDLRPAFVCGPASKLEPLRQRMPAFVRSCVPNAKVVTFFSFIVAANLMCFLPILLLTGYLGAWWRVSLCVALSIQVSLAFEIYRQGARWRSLKRGDFWQHFIPLVLNPLAALRCGDALLVGLLRAGDHEVAGRRSE